MEFDRLPSKPIVKSSIGAQNDWDSWLSANNYDHLFDAEGVKWQMLMTLDRRPSSTDPLRGEVCVSVQIAVEVSVKDLISTGVLDADIDSRLIALAGSSHVPLKMKKLQYIAGTDAEMRELLSKVLPELRENFGKIPLNDVKRELFCRWIDESMLFNRRKSLAHSEF